MRWYSADFYTSAKVEGQACMLSRLVKWYGGLVGLAPQWVVGCQQAKEPRGKSLCHLTSLLYSLACLCLCSYSCSSCSRVEVIHLVAKLCSLASCFNILEWFGSSSLLK